MGQNTSKTYEKYNSLRLSGRPSGAGKPAQVRLKDGRRVTLENVCALYAKRHNKEDGTQLLNVIESNFDRLLRTKERRDSFMQLPKEALIKVLKSDDLYATSEYTILLLVGAWVDHRIEKRRAKAEKKKKGGAKSRPKEADNEKEKGVEEDEKDAEEPLPASVADDAEEPALDEESIATFLSNLNNVVVPPHKLTTEYEEKLRKGMVEFMEYIRFPTMPTEQLEMVMGDGLVPEQYIYEAVRHHAMIEHDADNYKKLINTNPRFKARCRYFQLVWDPKKKDTRLNLSKDGLTVTVVNGSGCAHKAIIGKYPICGGRVAWELTLNQRAGCYDAIGVVDGKFKPQLDQIIGIAQNSWGLSLYAGSHVANSNRRIQVPSLGAMNQGTKIKVVVDMDVGTIEFWINGTSQGKLKGLVGPLYPAMTMCEMTGGGHVIKQIPV